MNQITPTTIAICGSILCGTVVFFVAIAVRARAYARCARCGCYLDHDIQTHSALCQSCALNTALCPPAEGVKPAPIVVPVCQHCHRYQIGGTWWHTCQILNTNTKYIAVTCPACLEKKKHPTPTNRQPVTA